MKSAKFLSKFLIFHRAAPVSASEQTQEIPLIHFVVKGYFGYLAQIYRGCPILC